jgi:diguanylate cyclase (GGDEF)-like protein/PAS domain S-box-containing protein
MRTLPFHPGVVAFCALALGAGGLFGVLGWVPAGATPAVVGLVFVGILVSVLAAHRSSASETPATIAPSFVIEFMALLLVGPHAAMLVATSGVVAQDLADGERSHRLRRAILDAVTAVAAIAASGLVHDALGGTLGHFVWPWQGIPIAAAVVAYCLVKVISSAIVAPLVTGQPIERWWTGLLRGCPHSFVGAGVAVALVEVIDHRTWEVLPVAAVPLYFAYRVYSDYVKRLEDERRRLEVIDSVDYGMSVVGADGRVTLWNDALERIVGCPRQRVIGRSIPEAVPALATTELSRAFAEALASGTPRALMLGLPSPAGAQVLQVKIRPVAQGATLLWQDVTEPTRAEQALRRSEERLALAAEGANDGLWEWDLRRQELYGSGRWNAMLGLPARASVGSPDDWLGRVHAEDLAALKEALEAHLTGSTEHLQHEHRIRHEDGSYRWFLCRGVALKGTTRRSTRIAGSLTDTTDGAIAEERLRTAGFLDPLTGLCNRAVFVEELGRRLAELKQRRAGERFAVLYLDLDRFKIVNDSLGHLVGDELLIAVSRRLETCLRPADALARLGGDEFAILLDGLSDEQQANAIAFRIQEALSAPFAIAGREVFTSASIGIAFGRAHYTNPDEIMRDADTAMYHAKARGKARHELFDADMHARVRDRLGLESDLRHAVSNNDFDVHYQPIVLLASGMCVGFESLVRWKRNGEAISPATFIPMAEELGLIEPLGTWVLQQACQAFAGWRRRFPGGSLDYITVNVSSRQLMQQNLLYIVEQAVHQAGLKPCDLRLEITETALMDSPHMAADVLRQLREFGVKIYLDDFGTGYSSLSHLHKLPVDALKIDRSFVKSLHLPDRPAIVESILALARTLNTSVVAEGIESDAQATELERLGCTHAQGYLFSRPLSVDSVEALLMGNEPLGPKRVRIVEPGVAPAIAPDLFYSSVPFAWPEHVAVHPGAEAGLVGAAPGGSSELPTREERTWRGLPGHRGLPYVGRRAGTVMCAAEVPARVTRAALSRPRAGRRAPARRR